MTYWHIYYIRPKGLLCMNIIVVSIKEEVSNRDMAAKLAELEQLVLNISEFSLEFQIKPLYGKLMYYCTDLLDLKQHLNPQVFTVQATNLISCNAANKRTIMCTCFS